MNNKMNKIFMCFLSLSIILNLYACSDNPNVDQESNNNISKHEVNIEIDCKKNLLFSKYDVVVYVDESILTTIDHGDKDSYSLELEEGEHTIRFEKEEDSSVDGTSEFTIDTATSLKYEITCSSDQIEINEIKNLTVPILNDEIGSKTYLEIEKIFKDNGFDNIECVAVADLEISDKDQLHTVKQVIIDGNSSFDKDDIYFADSEIIIEYHVLEKIVAVRDSDDYYGMSYPDVKNEFENLGFINIKPGNVITDEIDDKDKVILVKISNWEFEKDEKFDYDDEVYIKYYEYVEPEKEELETLTIDNCPDLKALLKLKDPSDPSVENFARKYKGKIIEFDGCVTAFNNHGDYKTRYDILINSGDFDENSIYGPNFRLTDVNAYDMNLDDDDSISFSVNVHVIAEVGDYNYDTTIFELDPIEVHNRD